MGYLPVGLEVIHGESIPLAERPTNELGEDVESHFHAGDGCNNTNGDHENSAQRDTEEYHAGRSISVKASETRNSGCDGGNKQDHVPPLRGCPWPSAELPIQTWVRLTFRVFAHQAVVDVSIFGHFSS